MISQALPIHSKQAHIDEKVRKKKRQKTPPILQCSFKNKIPAFVGFLLQQEGLRNISGCKEKRLSRHKVEACGVRNTEDVFGQRLYFQ